MRDYPRIAIYNGDLSRLLVEVDDVEYMTFPGGEPHVKMSDSAFMLLEDKLHVVIDCRPRNFTDLGYLALLAHVVRVATGHKVRIDLLMPYFPGARQDRGTPFTAAFMADFVNSLNFGIIDIWDPHSPVIVEQLKKGGSIAWHMPDLPKWPPCKYVAVIVPDKGALERSKYIADKLGYSVELIHCEKKRDPVMGALSGFELVNDRLFPSLPEGTYLLFDDICDGGGTFNGVASVVSEAYRQQYGRAADIDLFVTHGIFSQGTEKLHQNFTTIYSTTSWRSHEELLRLDVIPVPIHNLENRE